MPVSRSSRLPVLLAALVAILAVAVSVLAAVPTATAAPGPAGARDPERTSFPYGIAVRPSSNVNAKLAQLPVEYRRAVRAWLDDAGKGLGEECSDTPWLKVTAYHRDGFVTSRQGLFPATGEPESCAGGGYASIWSKRGGPWREVIAGQEPPRCRSLVYHRVPRSMADGCFDDKGDSVSY